MFVVVPVKDQLPFTQGIVEQLTAQGGYDALFVYDNGSSPETADFLATAHGNDRVEVIDAAGRDLYEMWQDGVDRARARSAVCDVAILNNDLRLGPRLLVSLTSALRSDSALWAVSPRYDDRGIDGIEYVSGTFKHDGLAGFAFAVRGEAFDHIAFDPDFKLWFGDDDLVAQIERAGHKVAITGATWVDHIDGGGHTLRTRPRVATQLRADRRTMLTKWGHT
jgi:GT2 family glycosyltransferase